MGDAVPTRSDDAIHARAVDLLKEGRSLGPAELSELSKLREEEDEKEAKRKKSPDPKTKTTKKSDASYVPYPSLKDPEMMSKLESKREFAEHSATRLADMENSEDGRGHVRRTGEEEASRRWAERCPVSARQGDDDGTVEFELTRAQLLVRNFMAPGSPYNGLLVYHGVGVGKSCTAVAVAEQYADTMQNGVLVLTRPGLRENFRKTIFDISKVKLKPDGSPDYARSNQCTGTAYTDRIPDKRSLSLAQIDARIDRAIKKRYTFKGLGEFANEVEELGSGPAGIQRLRERFSNLVLIVDEAHNLRIGGNEGNGPTDGAKKASKMVTPALRRVLKCTENVKLLLLTATPMFNRPQDVLDLLNLLLSNDKRPNLHARDVFDADGGLKKPHGETLLAETCRGYVSYVEGGDPFAFPLRFSPSDHRDPAVLVPARVPTIDLRGEPIPKDRRLVAASASASAGVGLELVVSDLGKAQREAYLKTETGIKQIEDEDVDEDADAIDDEEDDEQDKRGRSASSAFHRGMQISNVTFPGDKTFDEVFKRVGGNKNGNENENENASMKSHRKKKAGSGIRLQYRPGVPAFLAPPLLRHYAPKMQTIVDRIRRSRGIVMVYSRFLPAGLVSLAIALEHVGFQRFESAPLLMPSTTPSPSARGGARPPSRGGVQRGPGQSPLFYAIISANRDFQSDERRVLAALTSPMNVNGSLIKVILVSDRGSEGLDLKCVREVHVLEPWFHLNKIEQVVGRASRYCSHAALPLEDRNLTVYLHASIRPRSWSPSEKETVDLRAYRLAELKQRNVNAVEAVLRRSAFDSRLQIDADAERSKARAQRDAAIVVKMRTSQGVTIAASPYERALLRSGAREELVRGPAEQKTPKNNKNTKRDDESTYDPKIHAYHRATHARLLRQFFAHRKTTSGSFEELWAHVRAGLERKRMLDPNSRDRMAEVLNDMVRNGAEVEGPHGQRLGTLLHRGDAYLFQPADEDLRTLTPNERALPRRRATHVVAVESLALAAAPSPSRRAATSPAMAAADALDHLETEVASLLARLGLASPSKASYADAAVDAVIDRLSRDRLVALAVAVCLEPKVKHAMAKSVRRSLVASGILDGLVILSAHHLPPGIGLKIDPRKGTTTEISTLVAADDADSRHMPAAPQRRRNLPKAAIGAVVVASAANEAPVFKLFEHRLPNDVVRLSPNKKAQKKAQKDPSTLADGGQGSGTVCHQSSRLSTDHLKRLIAAESKQDPEVVAAAHSVPGKRALCDLYEVVIRKHRPGGVLRST